MADPKKKWVDKFKAKSWGDDNGLSYELLAQAATKEPEPPPGGRTNPSSGTTSQDTSAPRPGPVSNARILAMLSKHNGGLYGGIEGYRGRCLQFSVKLMEELGAKRADGTAASDEKTRSRMGPLTARYRNQPLTALPKDLPAGYQICVVSRPDWGFTEVGNHWFISAGGGYYLDDVMGVTTASQMVESLLRTTADQWAQRVVAHESQHSLRDRMGEAFAANHRSVQEYRRSGRAPIEQQEKVKGKDNPQYREANEDERAGAAAVKAIVDANRATYAPRVWVVEPTMKG